MPLAMMSVGEIRTVLECKGKSEMKKHLQNLGFTHGERIQVLNENPSGLIILVKGVKLALNRGVASMIYVE